MRWRPMVETTSNVHARRIVKKTGLARFVFDVRRNEGNLSINFEGEHP